MIRIIRALSAGIAFAWASCTIAYPITPADTVTVNGEEWAQVDLFQGLTWNTINTVCPGGVCGNGTLNGYDMAGWIWATVADLNTLFNHYIGFAALGPGADSITGASNTFADSFFADGWRATAYSPVVFTATVGYHADSGLPNLSAIAAVHYIPLVCAPGGPCTPSGEPQEFYDVAATGTSGFVLPVGAGPGGWFVKRTPGEVPVPATFALFSLALAVLGYNRKSGRRTVG